MKRRHSTDSRFHRTFRTCFAVILGITAIGITCAASPSAREVNRAPRPVLHKTIATVAAHIVVNSYGQRVMVWRMTGSRVAIGLRGSTDVVVIHRDTTNFWSRGQRFEIIRYHAGGLWRAVRRRFGIDRSTVVRTLSSASQLQITSPFLRRPAGVADNEPPTTMTDVDDYGTDVAALARAAPFAIRYAGRSILGYSLANVSIDTLRNPYKNPARGHVVTNSGPMATLVYSSDSGHFAVNDRQIVLNLTKLSSQAGEVNAGFLNGSRRVMNGRKILAYRANDNQIAFKFGDVVAIATSTVAFTDGQWHEFLLALRSAA